MLPSQPGQQRASEQQFCRRSAVLKAPVRSLE